MHNEKSPQNKKQSDRSLCFQEKEAKLKGVWGIGIIGTFLFGLENQVQKNCTSRNGQNKAEQKRADHASEKAEDAQL